MDFQIQCDERWFIGSSARTLFMMLKGGITDLVTFPVLDFSDFIWCAFEQKPGGKTIRSCLLGEVADVAPASVRQVQEFRSKSEVKGG